MKHSKFEHLLILLLTLSPLSLLAQSAVSNVRAMQEGRNVVLLYDLSKDTEIQQVKIEVNGRSRVIPSSCLSGDVGKKVWAGTDRRIIYNVLCDYQDGLRSDDIYFIIEDNSTPMHNGHEYVDLGLSVKWATCNIGAKQPKERGLYYSWGEIKPKTTYQWYTYQWGRNNYLSKYNTNRNIGNLDNIVKLELSDDAAHVNLGVGWRIPTDKDWQELSTQCLWYWVEQNGYKGYKIVSKINGNSIFLPVTGYAKEKTIDYSYAYGYYWSSNLVSEDSNKAWYIRFSSKEVEWGYYYGRYVGLAIRPVCL